MQTKHNNTLPKVVLIGRANVGKSTLFNKIIDENKALVSDMEGTTRDTNQGQAYWAGVNFEVIDTGGINNIISGKKLSKLSPKANEDFALDILKRSQSAIKDADLILFIVDGITGVLPSDQELAKNLADYKNKTFLIVNKLDNFNDLTNAQVFIKLGFKEPVGISALTSNGVGDLLDEIVNFLKKNKIATKADFIPKEKGLKVAILGRPNVGKSSLFNKLIGEDKVIVSSKEHTTMEPNDLTIDYDGQKITFIDTAGIRRKAKISQGLEKASVAKSIQSIIHANVVLFVIDASKPIQTQDKHLAELLTNHDVAIIFVANKWDLIQDKHTNIQKEISQDIYASFPFLTWAPIIFVSAKTGQHTAKLFKLINEVERLKNTTAPQDVLDEFILRATKKHKPTAGKGILRPSILDFEQIRTNPPVFQMRIKPKDNISSNYLKYLENLLRKELKIKGTKLWIRVKK